MLLQECHKLGLLSEVNTSCLTAKRYKFCLSLESLTLKFLLINITQSISSSDPLPPAILLRAEDREFAPRLKTAENANIQPNPGLILRAEPTVTNILKVECQKLFLTSGCLQGVFSNDLVIVAWEVGEKITDKDDRMTKGEVMFPHSVSLKSTK